MTKELIEWLHNLDATRIVPGVAVQINYAMTEAATLLSRYQTALEAIAAEASVSIADLPDHGQPNGWRSLAVERIDIAREALK
jgi:hypothetical protein